MSECQRVELHEWLPEYVSGSLSAAQRAEVETHLASCAGARAELALVRSAREAIVRRTPAVDTAAVVAAVRASRAARSAPVFVISRRAAWRIAAAIAFAAIGGIGYWIGTHRAPVATEQTMANAPTPAVPAPPPVVPPTAPTAVPKLAPVPAPAPAPKNLAVARELSVPGGVADLPESETGKLLNDLEKAGASFETEPMADFDLGSGQ